MSSPKIDRYEPNKTSLVSDYRGESDVILGFYLSILKDNIFRTYWSASRVFNLIIQGVPKNMGIQ